MVNFYPSVAEGYWDGNGALIPGRQSWLQWSEHAFSRRKEGAGSRGQAGVH